MNPEDAFGYMKPGSIMLLLVLVSVGLTGHLAVNLWRYRQLEAWGHDGAGVHASAPGPMMRSGSSIETALPWQVIRRDPAHVAATQRRLSDRFRLIGMYLASGPGAEDDRRAILDDSQEDKEYIVKKDDKVGQVYIADIQADYVLLRDDRGEEKLWLKFTERPAWRSVENSPGGLSDQDRLERAFGARRLGPRRWEFDRARLLDYYGELMDHPERLVKVFDSLKPVYERSGRISGYRLEVEGERDFFAAAGLEEGDIVRKVNDLDMSNRRRAEYFIKQFVRDTISAFMLDVDRGGESVRFLYQVRE